MFGSLNWQTLDPTNWLTTHVIAWQLCVALSRTSSVCRMLASSLYIFSGDMKMLSCRMMRDPLFSRRTGSVLNEQASARKGVQLNLTNSKPEKIDQAMH